MLSSQPFLGHDSAEHLHFHGGHGHGKFTSCLHRRPSAKLRGARLVIWKVLHEGLKLFLKTLAHVARLKQAEDRVQMWNLFGTAYRSAYTLYEVTFAGWAFLLSFAAYRESCVIYTNM